MELAHYKLNYYYLCTRLDPLVKFSCLALDSIKIIIKSRMHLSTYCSLMGNSHFAKVE
jgi:hypothetical protein